MQKVKTLIRLINDGYDSTEALSITQIIEGCTLPELLTEAQNGRYFVYNEHNKRHPMINTLPSDVIAIAYGWSQVGERIRDQLFNILWPSISALPSIILMTDYADGYSVTPRWESYRVADLPRFQQRWQTGTPPAVRESSTLSTWAILDSEPPNLGS